MTTNLPAVIERPLPLVPAGIDLRDFAFMPLDVVRLRDSDLAATASPAAFRAAVLLWCAAWHQVPAGSLPDDDAVLVRLQGGGKLDGNSSRAWAKLRPTALHGFIKCADGRLYHPVIAEKAREAWEKKQNQRARTEAARKARLAKRSVTESVTEDIQTSVTESKGQGQGQLYKEERKDSLRESQRKRSPSVASSVDFQKFWDAYPNKVGKHDAELKFETALKSIAFAELMAGLQRYIDAKPADRAWCNPATWLNQQRWLDQPALPLARAPPNGVNGHPLSPKEQRRQEWNDVRKALQESIERDEREASGRSADGLLPSVGK